MISSNAGSLLTEFGHGPPAHHAEPSTWSRAPTPTPPGARVHSKASSTLPGVHKRHSSVRSPAQSLPSHPTKADGSVTADPMADHATDRPACSADGGLPARTTTRAQGQDPSEFRPRTGDYQIGSHLDPYSSSHEGAVTLATRSPVSRTSASHSERILPGAALRRLRAHRRCDRLRSRAPVRVNIVDMVVVATQRSNPSG